MTSRSFGGCWCSGLPGLHRSLCSSLWFWCKCSRRGLTLAPTRRVLAHPPQIEKKAYFPIFKLTGFQGFDGDWQK